MTVWDAKVTPPPTPEELRAMTGDELVYGLSYQEIFVCGGANKRGETITEETVAHRNALQGEILRRLTLLDKTSAVINYEWFAQ